MKIQIHSLLQQLTLTEQKAFLLFLKSPYFNRQPRLERLGRLLIEQADSDSLQKRNLHEVLYGKTATYREQAIHDSLSQLNKLLQRFLALRKFEADQAAQQLALLSAFAQRQWEAAFRKHWNRASAAWEEYGFRDLDYFEGQYAVHREAAVFEAGLQRRERDFRLEETVKYLDLSYWIARLKYSCELLNRLQILNQEIPSELIDPMEAWLDAMPKAYLVEPAIQSYLLIFRTLQVEDAAHSYDALIDWLNHNSHHFSPREAADMYNYAQNYCIRRINRGEAMYLQRLFALFEQLASKQLVLDEHGYMDHRNLKNMVTVGLRLKAFGWVDNFLETYKHKLLPAYQADAYAFNLASLRYAQGLYSEALQLLQQVEFQDVFYDLSARSLMLKLYFETDEDAALEFLLETFRMFVKRNRSINAFQRKVHMNLLRFTRKLYRLREQQAMLPQKTFEQRRAKLSALIQEEKEIANRSWLLEQLEELGREG